MSPARDVALGTQSRLLQAVGTLGQTSKFGNGHRQGAWQKSVLNDKWSQLNSIALPLSLCSSQFLQPVTFDKNILKELEYVPHNDITWTPFKSTPAKCKHLFKPEIELKWFIKNLIINIHMTQMVLNGTHQPYSLFRAAQCRRLPRI